MELTVCTETEPVPFRVLSPHHFFRILQKSLSRLSLHRFVSSLNPSLPQPYPYLAIRTPCFPSSQEPSCLFLSALHLVPSALAVGERETALGSPCLGTPRSPHTYTPLFPRCTFSSQFPFLLCDPCTPDPSAHPRASFTLSRLLCGPLPINW